MLDYIKYYVYKLQIEHIGHRQFESKGMEDVILWSH